MPILKGKHALFLSLVLSSSSEAQESSGSMYVRQVLDHFKIHRTFQDAQSHSISFLVNGWEGSKRWMMLVTNFIKKQTND